MAVAVLINYKSGPCGPYFSDINHQVLVRWELSLQEWLCAI